LISGKGRLGGLKIKTHEGSNCNIPVIVESPIEDLLEEEFLVVGPTSICDDDHLAALAPKTAPINGSQPRFTLNAPRIIKRGLTDPTNGNLNRKKSMIANPFKRAAYDDSSPTPSGELPRLRIKTSFSNITRSVVGTLSRRTSPDHISERGKMLLDPSHHLPSSPILSGKMHSPTSPGFSRSEEGEVRRAVSPILYSPGHILMEASHIKDEESRRVTEMAFLT